MPILSLLGDDVGDRVVCLRIYNNIRHVRPCGFSVYKVIAFKPSLLIHLLGQSNSNDRVSVFLNFTHYLLH